MMIEEIKREGTERQPLYVQVAHSLSEGISDNRFPVGSLLPTEEELSEKFGVGRHTIREAIRHLRVQGLLSARRGIGTRVEARRSNARYTQSLHSLDELLQYTQETTLEVFGNEELAVDAALADQLGSRAGKGWVHVQGLRKTAEEGLPICWTDLYIDKTYAAVAKDASMPRLAVYTMIERRYGETVVEVQQDIQATLIPAERAGLLNVSAGAPALSVSRRYFGAGGRLLEVAFNLHPADRFVYSMRLRRDAS